MRILFRDKWKVPYHSNCNVMVCRFYPGDELNTTLNTLSCNVFFLSSQIRTYFKNINSLTLCLLLLVHFGRKMQVFTRGSFFYYYCISFSSKREWASSAWVQKYSSSTLTWIQLRLEDQHRKIFNYYSPKAKSMLIEASVVYLQCSLPC